MTKELHIYQARMKDNLVSALSFFRVRDSDVAWIDACMSLDTRSLMEDSEDPEEWERSDYRPQAIPTLVRPPAKPEEHRTVLVNEPKLSDMKNILQVGAVRIDVSFQVLELFFLIAHICFVEETCIVHVFEYNSNRLIISMQYSSCTNRRTFKNPANSSSKERIGNHWL